MIAAAAFSEILIIENVSFYASCDRSMRLSPAVLQGITFSSDSVSLPMMRTLAVWQRNHDAGKLTFIGATRNRIQLMRDRDD
jgi:hypothetical protein